MTPDSKPPIGRLLRTVLLTLTAAGALGTGTAAASAQPAAAHHRQYRAHHGTTHRTHHRTWHQRRARRGRYRAYRARYGRRHHWYRTDRGHRHGRGHWRPTHRGAVHHLRPARRAMPRFAGRGTETAVHFVLAHLGDGYSYGGNGPHWWDCSGLVQQAYRRAGIRLPRVAAAQYRAARPIRRSQLRRGDLVFWTSNGHVSGIHHVAVYLGRGHYVEAPRPGRRVRVSSFAAYRPTLYARV